MCMAGAASEFGWLRIAEDRGGGRVEEADEAIAIDDIERVRGGGDDTQERVAIDRHGNRRVRLHHGIQPQMDLSRVCATAPRAALGG